MAAPLTKPSPGKLAKNSSINTQVSVRKNQQSPRFLDPIVLEADKVPSYTQTKFSNNLLDGSSANPAIQAGVTIQPNELSFTIPFVETIGSLQIKYAILLDTAVEYLPDELLLQQMDEWMGVRYRSGGSSKNGIDCSGFTATIYAGYFGLQLPRTSKQQYEVCERVEPENLRAGDLLFFNTRGRGVSHVGIYLGNNKFIHASVSSGVIVSDRYEPYYLKRFLGAGRLPQGGFAE